MSERWLPVPGYEGYYEVSNQGRFRSLDRWVMSRWGKPMWRRGKILSWAVSVGAKGYPRVYLCRDGEVKEVLVHTTVAAAFLGPRPDGLQVLHWDDDKMNCHVENLRYGTFSDNLYDRARNRRGAA